ncbi:MAG: PilN domain-containing protein [Saccharofermentans sp.]|nr:PilN domain-containing protein [Saccharofermentans sp.]
MALLGSSKGISKKDINFFEEYTAAAKKTARYLAYFIFAALVVIAIFVVWWFIAFLQNNAIKKDITAMEERLASEEFKDVEILAAQYEADLTNKNQQLYAMSSMRNFVDRKTYANPALLDLLMDSIPTDAYIQAYELNGDKFTIQGQSFTDYSASNLVAIFQDEQNVFNSSIPTTIDVNRVNGVMVINPDGTVDPIDCYYDFKIVGSLTNTVNVSISSYANINGEIIALGGVVNKQYSYGDSYINDEVNTFTYNGTEYTLTGIRVNSADLAPDALSEIMSTGTHRIKNLTGDVSVTYYYSVVVAAEEEGEA